MYVVRSVNLASGALGLLAFLLVGSAMWVVLAASRFVQGGNVDNANRVPQLYGYTVCLVAVVTFLLSVSIVVAAFFDLANPLEANRSPFPEASLTSFEAYRATYTRAEGMTRWIPDQRKPDTLPESDLHRRYDALRTDRMASVRFQAVRSITVSSLLLVLSVLLFITHWRWLRKRAASVG